MFIKIKKKTCTKFSEYPSILKLSNFCPSVYNPPPRCEYKFDSRTDLRNDTGYQKVDFRFESDMIKFVLSMSLVISCFAYLLDPIGSHVLIAVISCFAYLIDPIGI